MRWMVLVRQLSWFYLAWFVSIGSIVHITVGRCKFIFYIVEVVYRSLPPILYIFTPPPDRAVPHRGGKTSTLHNRNPANRYALQHNTPPHQYASVITKRRKLIALACLCCCRVVLSLCVLSLCVLSCSVVVV